MKKPRQQLLDRKYGNHIWGTSEYNLASGMGHTKGTKGM
jgi:hypothetical protein